jgi:DNA replication protein DnaC
MRLRITIRSALNLAYPEWQTFLGNKALVDALLSRLRHRCHTVNIDGPSLRDPQG